MAAENPSGLRGALFVTLVALSASCGADDGSGSVDGASGAEATGSAGTSNASAGSGNLPTEIPLIPITAIECSDGYRSQDEAGHDCGGSCENQDCCTNGYADVELGETGVDCGGECGSCGATTYFVSNSGSDDNAGTSPDVPWASIAKVNATDLAPGDAILFQRGGTWRETLEITNSGSADAFIQYGAYGLGEKPRILGSERVAGWVEVSGYPGVYESTNELQAPREREGNSTTNHPASLFFGETNGAVTWGNMEALHLNSEGAPIDLYQCDSEGERFSLLDREYDWCWQENHIYVYSPGGDPGAHYDFVEVPQRSASIRMASHPPAEHISIDGFELLFALKYGHDDGWPMTVVARGLDIKNNHIGWMGTKGAASAIGLQIWHSDMLVHNNVIHDCGRRSISYNTYADQRDSSLTFENVTFQYNTLYHGYHTTGFDISCGYADTVFNGFVFRNNFVWDDPNDDPQASPNDFTSMGYFLDSGGATFTNFKVYNNVLKYLKQKSMVLAGLSNSEVFNNTFYSMNSRAGGDYRGMITVSGDTSSLRIENNLFYGDVSSDAVVLQCVTFSGDSAAGTSMNHNLYFQQDADQRIVDSYRMSDWADYLADTGWDADSPEPQDPLFVDPDNNDLSLLSGSPAIDAAAEEADRTTDFAGNPIVGVPDIGAFEFQGG